MLADLKKNMSAPIIDIFVNFVYFELLMILNKYNKKMLQI